MPVVFDEVVGSVEAPRPATAEEPRAGSPPKTDDRQVRATLRRLEQREARLRAD